MRITFKNRCPYCDSVYFVRIPRKFYMRISSFIKNYECDLCRQEFMIYEKNSAMFEERLLERPS